MRSHVFPRMFLRIFIEVTYLCLVLACPLGFALRRSCRGDAHRGGNQRENAYDDGDDNQDG